MSRKPARSRGALRQWRITEVRAKGRHIGLVEAPDAVTAIEEALKLFNIPEAQRSRLIAQPVE